LLDIPVVRALMRPARRPLKSLKTSSTVRGLYCVRASIVASPGLVLRRMKVEVGLGLKEILCSGRVRVKWERQVLSLFSLSRRASLGVSAKYEN